MLDEALEAIQMDPLCLETRKQPQNARVSAAESNPSAEEQTKRETERDKEKTNVFFFLLLFPLYGHRLGVTSELQLPAYTRTIATPDLSRICTYTTAHGHAGSLTH